MYEAILSLQALPRFETNTLHIWDPVLRLLCTSLCPCLKTTITWGKIAVKITNNEIWWCCFGEGRISSSTVISACTVPSYIFTFLQCGKNASKGTTSGGPSREFWNFLPEEVSFRAYLQFYFYSNSHSSILAVALSSPVLSSMVDRKTRTNLELSKFSALAMYLNSINFVHALNLWSSERSHAISN